MLRKTLCCILSCIAILCLTVTSVLASESAQEPRDTGSISFDFHVGSKPITKGELELRLVARWDPNTGALTWLDEYAPLALDITNLDDMAAKRLYVYAEWNRFSYTTLQVGSDGTAHAENLELGMYLVSQNTAFEGYYTLLPSLVCVPLNINGQAIYDVDATPKLAPLTEVPPPETTEPDEPPDLPDTGQVNWPVPFLVLGGVLLMILGICLRKEKRNETEG